MRKNLNLFHLSALFLAVIFSFFLYLTIPHLYFLPWIVAIFGLFPYYFLIIEALVKRQVDLSLPVIITIYVLLILGKGTTALIFILLILLGEIFKTFILEKVKSSVMSISARLPKTALIKTKEGEKEVEITDIQINNILKVKTGARIATDAVLISPEGLLDESIVTGESKPVTKKKGDKILAGSINLGNYFDAKTIATAKNSTLLQIQHLVERAQNEKGPLAGIVNTYAWITIVVALCGVLIIFITTHDILKALSFWIAIVPVIFALIVPVATTIGISILAKIGILVKSSKSLEELTKVNTIFFDKTGTITQGKPEVETIIETDGKKNDILTLAASLESYSNHPLSIPIIKNAQKKDVKLQKLNNIQTLAGKGMIARKNKNKIFVGNDKLLSELNIPLSAEVKKTIRIWEGKGGTPVFVGENNRLLGIIILLDRLRENIQQLITTLSQKRFRITILTGDKKEVVKEIVNKLTGVTFYSELLPQEKVDIIDAAIQKKMHVIMVGDGINDAPAMAKSSVGIAMGLQRVDLTLNAADVVLVNDNIELIPTMIDVSKKTFRIIKEDIALATIIHVASALLVVFGVLNIIQTTFVHEFSSVLVLINTLRLLRIGTQKKI